MEAFHFQHRTVLYNVSVFSAWTLTSFLCHYAAKKFLILLSASTAWATRGLEDQQELSVECILTLLLHAAVLTAMQLSLCVMALNLEDMKGQTGNKRRAKLYHALATLATNVSMAFTFASSTFAIKMMEPITSALIQYCLLGTPLSPLALLSLPLIVSGAIAFAGMPTTIGHASIGLGAALLSNILLAPRNIACKEMSLEWLKVTGGNSSPPLRLAPRFLIWPAGLVLGTLLYSYQACREGQNERLSLQLPLTTASPGLLLAPLSVALSGLFHLAYTYISTGLVLAQMSVVSHAVVNIAKRLTVVLLLHAYGQRVAGVDHFVGLAVCAVGLFIYSWDKARNLVVHEPTTNKQRVFRGKLLKNVTWALTFFGCIATISLYSPNTTSMRFLTQYENFTLSPQPVWNLFGFKGLDKPDEDALLPGSNLPDSVMKESPMFLQLPLNEHPNVSNLLSRELATSDEVIREAQRLHFNIIGKELEGFKYAMLFDVAAFENKGDPCITTAEIYFIIRMNIQLVYYCTSENCTKNNLNRARDMVSTYKVEEIVILLQGGGNIIGYFFHDVLRFKILDLFSGYKILLFPQSIWIPKTLYANANKTIAHYCCNSNLTIFLRDSVSFQLAKTLYKGETKLLMAPDMVFQIGRVPRFMSPVYDILWIARDDHESDRYVIPRTFPPNLKVHIADWNTWATPKADSSLEWAFFMATNGFFFVQRGRVVITDRLHGHILSTLCDIPHVLLDNKWHKTGNYHNTWTASLSNVLITNDPEEALAMAVALLEKYDDILPKRVPFLDIEENFQTP